MKTFNYTVKDEIGIHARPAGMLAKEAKKYESKIVIKKGEKSAEATKLMAIMGMGVKHGESKARMRKPHAKRSRHFLSKTCKKLCVNRDFFIVFGGSRDFFAAGTARGGFGSI